MTSEVPAQHSFAYLAVLFNSLCKQLPNCNQWKPYLLPWCKSYTNTHWMVGRILEHYHLGTRDFYRATNNKTGLWGGGQGFTPPHKSAGISTMASSYTKYLQESPPNLIVRFTSGQFVHNSQTTLLQDFSKPNFTFCFQILISSSHPGVTGWLWPLQSLQGIWAEFLHESQSLNRLLGSCTRYELSSEALQNQAPHCASACSPKCEELQCQSHRLLLWRNQTT